MFDDALRAYDPLHSPWCLKVLRWNEGLRRFGGDYFDHAVRSEHLVDAGGVQRVQRAAISVEAAFRRAGHRGATQGAVRIVLTIGGLVENRPHGSRSIIIT